ncbi:hypothetical protein K458DRAFT_389123 [Lentithecium fluviatile CBS 122367]|uniref:Uncharacterized protein n=1 Tax=Lentithecium fluviatile CBS 122367 TaxID=1168545 RepID=A0A6G1J077_9PLEO|nr:hypothetical protein K458DRAFT_389123 [Lentithecium fluviatile CBS 122367]
MTLLNLLLAAGSGVLMVAATVPSYGTCHESWEAPQDYIFPNVRTTDPTDATFKPHFDNCLHNREALDKPRVLPRPNATTFEVWYFDAINRANANESVTVMFFLATGDSVPGIRAPVTVRLFFGFADGSVEAFQVDAVDREEGAARVHVEGAGSSGTWGATGAEWTGNSDGNNYVVNINSPELDVFDTLKMDSIAPPHYPCTTELTEKTTLQLFPGLSWTAHIPDAKVSADFTVTSPSTKKSKDLNMKDATGWHDYTFANRPWASVIDNWTYGRASIGSGKLDTINWFQGEDGTGKVHTSAYIARDGKAIVSKCETVNKRGEEKLVKVQPGEKMTSADILMTDGKTCKVEMYKDVEIESDGKGHGRWSGVAVSGRLRGQGFHEEGVFSTSRS